VACWRNAIEDAFALCKQIKNLVLKRKMCQYTRVWNSVVPLTSEIQWEMVLSYEPPPWDDGTEERAFLFARGNQRAKQLAGNLNAYLQDPQGFTEDAKETLKVQCEELKGFNDDFQMESQMMGDLGKIFAYFKAEITKNK
jgi:hypothetical protein